jgi:hypothetical protein
MDIKRNGSQPSGKGPAEWFTGTVRVDPLFEAPVPARGRGASVTFEPGAHRVAHARESLPSRQPRHDNIYRLVRSPLTDAEGGIISRVNLADEF